MRVSIIVATTLCGRIAPGGMSSTLDRRFLEAQRAGTDASLLGAGTLREGDAQMRGPGGDLPPRRLRSVISASGNLPLEDRALFREGPPPLLFTSQAAAPALIRRLAGRAEVIALPAIEGLLSLRHLVDELSARGARTLLVEGGAHLNYAALQQGVVDEVLVTITPKLSGQAGAASLADGPAPLGSPFLDLTLLACEQAATGELFCRYRVNPPRS
ncbi:MAG: RibD family protein [Thermodesulfobacteriota bacterium]